MAQEESKNLQKYFENDPPSFFDDLAVKEGEAQSIPWSKSEVDKFSEEPQKISAVRDLWPHPDKGDNRHTPTVTHVTTEALVGHPNPRKDNLSKQI